MSRMIPSAERIKRTRDLPVPAEGGKYELLYIAQVKDLLQQARDLAGLVRVNLQLQS